MHAMVACCTLVLGMVMLTTASETGTHPAVPEFAAEAERTAASTQGDVACVRVGNDIEIGCEQMDRPGLGNCQPDTVWAVGIAGGLYGKYRVRLYCDDNFVAGCTADYGQASCEHEAINNFGGQFDCRWIPIDPNSQDTDVSHGCVDPPWPSQPADPTIAPPTISEA